MGWYASRLSDCLLIHEMGRIMPLLQALKVGSGMIRSRVGSTCHALVSFVHILTHLHVRYLSSSCRICIRPWDILRFVIICNQYSASDALGHDNILRVF